MSTRIPIPSDKVCKHLEWAIERLRAVPVDDLAKLIADLDEEAGEPWESWPEHWRVQPRRQAEAIRYILIAELERTDA